MIPRAHIIEWQKNTLWKTNAQIEQDLVIARELIELFSDNFLVENLAFRGGTALHKLYLQPQPRYSEDIDLVQITAFPFGPIIDRIKERLKFLGKPKLKQKENNNTLIYHFESEFPPVQVLKLKVETNCREHFSVLDYQRFPFEVKSSWFTGTSNITTYKLEELLGTKLRALYQRKKGRDLYDIFKALKQVPGLDKQAILHCYHEYMKFVVDHPPNQKLYQQNLEEKMRDPEFLGDIIGLIRHDEKYNMQEAYELVRTELIEKI